MWDGVILWYLNCSNLYSALLFNTDFSLKPEISKFPNHIKNYYCQIKYSLNKMVINTDNYQQFNMFMTRYPEKHKFILNPIK